MGSGNISNSCLKHTGSDPWTSCPTPHAKIRWTTSHNPLAPPWAAPSAARQWAPVVLAVSFGIRLQQASDVGRALDRRAVLVEHEHAMLAILVHATCEQGWTTSSEEHHPRRSVISWDPAMPASQVGGDKNLARLGAETAVGIPQIADPRSPSSMTPNELQGQGGRARRHPGPAS